MSIVTGFKRQTILQMATISFLWSPKVGKLKIEKSGAKMIYTL